MKYLRILGWLISLALLIVGLRVTKADNGPEDVLRERVDLLEVNVLYTDDGQYSMSQLIAWEWKGERYRVIDWRAMKSGDQWPQRQWSSVKGGGYKVLWKDGEVLREIYAPAFRYTESQHGVGGDPELLDREFTPKEERRGLRTPQQTKRQATGAR